MRIAPLLFLLAPIAACTPDYSVGGKAGDGTIGLGMDGTDGEGELAPEDFDGATIRIVSPEDGAFLPLGEPTTFEAELLDDEGEPLDYGEITWTTSLDPDWAVEGASAELDDLPVGRHTFRATALLPNGDQVTDAVGGILVQHEDAGVYAGNMVLDATGEFEGTPITASCIGAAVLVVDAYGETASGDSTCLLSLLGFSQELEHQFAFDVSSGDLDGSATVDAGFFAQDFDATGELDDGELSATWGDNLFGFADLEGRLVVERITRDLSGE